MVLLKLQSRSGLLLLLLSVCLSLSSAILWGGGLLIPVADSENCSMIHVRTQSPSSCASFEPILCVLWITALDWLRRTNWSIVWKRLHTVFFNDFLFLFVFLKPPPAPAPAPGPSPGLPCSKFVSRLHYYCFLLFCFSLFQPNVGFPDMDFHGVRIPSELSSLLLWILSPCTTLLSLKKLKNQHSTDIIKRERKGTRASNQLTSSSLERSTLAETAALEHWISLASSESQYISTIIHSAAGLQVLTRALQSVKLIWSSESAAIFRFVQCSISCWNEAARRSCCCCNNVLNNQGASGVPVVSGRKAWASSHDRRRVSHSSKWPPLERHAHFSSPTMHAYNLHLQVSERERNTERDREMMISAMMVSLQMWRSGWISCGGRACQNPLLGHTNGESSFLQVHSAVPLRLDSSRVLNSSACFSSSICVCPFFVMCSLTEWNPTLLLFPEFFSYWTLLWSDHDWKNLMASCCCNEPYGNTYSGSRACLALQKL